LDLCAACVPLPAELPPGTLCGECQHHLPPYAVCHAAFRYEGPVTALVGGVKFRARLNLARLLG